MKRIGIVGLGLIGKERLKAVEILQQRNLPIKISAIYDPWQKDIESLSSKCKATICLSIDDMIAQHPDLIIVAVPHDTAVEVTTKFLSAGLNVLLEKPMGRSLQEAYQLAESCSRPSQLSIAHNYRFFAGIAALLHDIQANHFGQPIGFSLLFGHGGRPEDQNSWKLNKERAGGGALIDPGIHLIDLCNLVAENLEFIGGLSWNGFWKTGIEEECRLLLRSKNIPMLDLTISVIRWRSTFRLEFFGENGYGIVVGRGRSYGAQQYYRGQRWGWQSGKSQSDSEELVLTSSGDHVFADELQSILFETQTDPIQHVCTVSESISNMRILEEWHKKLQNG